MNLLTKIAGVEKEISEYIDATGKDAEHVFDEIKEFLVGKKVEAQNAQAAKSDPTTSGPAAASAGAGTPTPAASTAGANTNTPTPPKTAA